MGCYHAPRLFCKQVDLSHFGCPFPCLSSQICVRCCVPSICGRAPRLSFFFVNLVASHWDIGNRAPYIKICAFSFGFRCPEFLMSSSSLMYFLASSCSVPRQLLWRLTGAPGSKPWKDVGRSTRSSYVAPSFVLSAPTSLSTPSARGAPRGGPTRIRHNGPPDRAPLRRAREPRRARHVRHPRHPRAAHARATGSRGAAMVTLAYSRATRVATHLQDFFGPVLGGTRKSEGGGGGV